jgi:hypothetical protein
VEHLVDAARRRGILTLGIGDMGNEMGFGAIEAAVRTVVPRADVCQCPCAQGMASAVVTDIVIPASVSNWGAYGVEAALAFLLEKPELMHTPKMEERVITKCLEAGGLEAMYCSTAFVVDNCEGESSMAVVQLLGNMVRLNLQSPDVGVAH